MQFTHALTAVVLTLGAAAPALAQHDHGGDIIVGRTGVTEPTALQLAIEADLEEPVFLTPVTGLFNGWTASHPGFDALGDDEPDESFWMLASGAEVRLEVVAIDSGLALVQSGGGAFADASGESILLGGSALHTHPTWYAQSSVLGSDWTGALNATFRLIDDRVGGYTASEPFIMTFTNVPEPASLALLSLGTLAIVYRGARRS